MLLRGLPADAAVYRAMPELAGWTITDHLLAAVIDTLGHVGHNALIGAHVDPKKLRGVKPPTPMFRPGTPAKPARIRKSVAELARDYDQKKVGG